MAHNVVRLEMLGGLLKKKRDSETEEKAIQLLFTQKKPLILVSCFDDVSVMKLPINTILFLFQYFRSVYIHVYIGCIAHNRAVW